MSVINKKRTLSGVVDHPQINQTETISLALGTVVTGVKIVSKKTTTTQARATIVDTLHSGRNAKIVYRGAGQIGKNFRTVISVDISFDPIIDPE
ncbi:MAG: hypothetical protein JKY19_13605 [Alcanivoracaceae bacterium]|nr:hypothetical protein [Alcanivoracaceae bacterium]